MSLRALSPLPLLALLLGCPTREVECRTGIDCASGACRADGTCAPASDAGVVPDAGVASDAGTDAGVADAGVDAGTPLTCAPNQDGTITRAEMPLGAGLHATFRIGKNATVSTLGAALADGGRDWDLSGVLAGDHSVLVETRSLEGAWFQAKFPGATYAVQLADGQDLLGVFEVTSDALLLRGVVSTADGLARTELVYSPPAKVLAFPLTRGDSFQSSSTVSGLANGLISAYSEDYVSTSDQVGELNAPFGRFPVQRVKVVLTRTVGLMQTVTRSFLYVTECFGTVGTIVSQLNETSAEFTSASEVRRLSP